MENFSEWPPCEILLSHVDGTWPPGGRQIEVATVCRSHDESSGARKVERMRELWSKLRTMLRGQRNLAEDLREEIESHVAFEIEECRAQGMTTIQANHEGRRRFGNHTLIHEAARESWTFPPVESLLQDLKYGLRMLRRSPGFTAVAVASLALGIGATTVMFSVANAVFLKPIAGEQPERLVRVGSTRQGTGFFSISYPDYLDYRNRNQVFDGILLCFPASAHLGGDVSRTIQAEIVTGNYFSVLGTRPVLGRGFLPEEDRTPRTHPVVVISDDLWRHEFGGNPRITGASIRINGYPFTIIGVAPPRFAGTFPGLKVDAWVPIMMNSTVRPGSDVLARRDAHEFNSIARLRPGVSLDQALAAMTSLAASLQVEHPASSPGRGVRLEPARGLALGQGALVPAMAVFIVVVGLVLLITCTNLTSLLLARGEQRHQEMAIRISVGAGRIRVVRQLIVESMLLAAMGGLGALLVCLWAGRIFPALLPTEIPLAIDLGLDERVFVFTFVTAGVTTLLFGLAPAMRMSRPDVSPALKARANQVGVSRTRNALLAAQMAMSLLLLIGAGLLIQSLRTSGSMDPGFDARNLLALSIRPDLREYDQTKTTALLTSLVERLRDTREVQGVTMAQSIPLGPISYQSSYISIHEQTPYETRVDVVADDYFKTLRIPMLQGRDFGPADRAGAPQVAIINDALANRLLPGAEVVGERLRLGELGLKGEVSQLEVIGIARTTKIRSLAEPPMPLVYLPLRQNYLPAITVFVRATHQTDMTSTIIRDQLQALDPDLPYSLRLVNDAIRSSVAPTRIAGAVLGACGLLALLLAVVGIYGVASYSVAQRTSEIGIRMALGSSYTGILRLVISQGLKVVVLGASIGIVAALGLTQVLSRLLYGLGPRDPAVFLSVLLLMLTTALTALYVPAHRAAKLDPMAALRVE